MLPWVRRASLTFATCTCATAKIQNDLRILTERLARINDNLARKISSRNEYDKTIQETEAAYAKVPPSPCARPILRVGGCPCVRPGACPPTARPARSISSPDRLRRRPLVLRSAPAPHTPHPPLCTDHGVVANPAARAQARERQPHEEEAGVQLIGRRRTLKALILCRAPPLHTRRSRSAQ